MPDTLNRQPVSATARVVAPYLYEVAWRLAQYGPLTAAEIAEDHNRSLNNWQQWTSQATANRLRSLVHLGLVVRDEDGFYLLSSDGRHWITNGAER